RAQVRKQITDPFATLAVLSEVPARLDDPALILDPAAAAGLYGHRLVVHALHRGLVIKRVDMTRAAVHEQEDHAPHLGREMRRLRSQGIDKLRYPIGG